MHRKSGVVLILLVLLLAGCIPGSNNNNTTKTTVRSYTVDCGNAITIGPGSCGLTVIGVTGIGGGQ